MSWTEILEEFDTVAEMTSDPAAVVKLPQSVVETVTEGDDDPRFATFEIRSGWSKAKRYWGAELFQNIAEQINDGSEPIVGYMGHIAPENDAYEFPEIQLQWLGAKLLQAGQDAKLAVKAYVLPGTKGREYLRRGLVKTVSWRGSASQVPYEKGVRVKDFMIESIDLSRPRKAGMSARLVGGLTSEMDDEGGKNVKPEEIAALQENELRAHNPGLITSIEAGARKPLEEQVSEMEATATAEAPKLATIPEFRKLLGLADDSDDLTVLQAAVASIRDAGKTLRDSVISKVLDSKIKDGESADGKLLRRVLVGEMAQKNFNPTGDEDADVKTVQEMVNGIIDGDESMKKLVSEMEATPVSPPTSHKDSHDNRSRELKPGYANSRIRVRTRA